MDAFGPEWEEQQYAALAPKVEAIVNRSFGFGRGARFGAQGSILAKRLAALRTEIATQAAVQKATLDETKRKEAATEKSNQDKYYRDEASKRNEAMQRQEEKRLENWQKESDYTRGKRDWYDAQNEMARRAVFMNPEKEYDDVYLDMIDFPKEKREEIKSRGKFGPISSGQPGSEGVGGTGFSSPVDDAGKRDYASDYANPKTEVSPVLSGSQNVPGNTGWRPSPPAMDQADPQGRLLVGSPGKDNGRGWRWDNGGGGWVMQEGNKSTEGQPLWSAPSRDRSSQYVGPSQYKGYATGTLHGKTQYGSSNIWDQYGNRTTYPGSIGMTPFTSDNSGFNEDDKNKYLRKPGHGTSVEEGYKSGTNYTDTYNRDFGSGNWTPGGFRKTWRDTVDTSKNIWNNMSSLWGRG